MIFYNSSKPPDFNSVQIKLNNNILPRVDSTKFWGIFIDSKLTWKKSYACTWKQNI